MIKKFIFTKSNYHTASFVLGFILVLMTIGCSKEVWKEGVFGQPAEYLSLMNEMDDDIRPFGQVATIMTGSRMDSYECQTARISGIETIDGMYKRRWKVSSGRKFKFIEVPPGRYLIRMECLGRQDAVQYSSSTTKYNFKAEGGKFYVPSGEVLSGVDYASYFKPYMKKPGENTIELIKKRRKKVFYTKDWSKVHVAAFQSPTDLEQIIAKGQDVNIATNDGETPLHIASFYGQEKSVELLLKFGANVNAKDSKGDTALHKAIFRKHLTVVKLLLNSGAETSLHLSSALGDVLKVKNQLSIIKNVNKKDSSTGLTPLHFLCRYGLSGNLEKVADLLLTHDAKVNTRAPENDGGELSEFTPLHDLGLLGNYNLTKLIVAHGAEVNAKTLNGLTPLHTVAQSGNFQIAKLLIMSGAEVNAFHIPLGTPLHIASEFGNTELKEILLANGADSTIVNSYDLTPSQWAKQAHEYKNPKWILKNGGSL